MSRKVYNCDSYLTTVKEDKGGVQSDFSARLILELHESDFASIGQKQGFVKLYRDQ